MTGFSSVWDFILWMVIACALSCVLAAVYLAAPWCIKQVVESIGAAIKRHRLFIASRRVWALHRMRAVDAEDRRLRADTDVMLQRLVREREELRTILGPEGYRTAVEEVAEPEFDEGLAETSRINQRG